MFKLTILCRYDPMSELSDLEIELPMEYENEDKATLRAMRWLIYRPNDIIALVSV